MGYKTSYYLNQSLSLTNTPKNELIRQYKKMGIFIDDVGQIAKLKRLIKKPNFFDNNQIQVGLGMHAYGLTKENDKDGNEKYYLYNPHSQGFPISFDNIDDLLKKATSVTVVNLE